MKRGNKWPTAVDLYCGCGAVTAGLKRRGFRVVAAVDNDPVACSTYRRNHPRVQLYENDVAEVKPDDILNGPLNGKHVDLLVVCAPCQPFSSQNRKNRADSRATLMLKAIDFAKILRPKLIFFENVPGMKRVNFAPILDRLQTELVHLGYAVTAPAKIDAADYGVPQRRSRCVMMAKRGGTPPNLPSPTTPDGKRVIVADVIHNLPRLATGEGDRNDKLHFARNHSSIALKRLSYIPKDGGSRASLPEDLQLPCHIGHRGHPDVYGRMKWNEIAPTLTTGCTDITKGRFAHPEDDRAISLREAARLQTISDKYSFCGSTSDIARQIGNAVPVRLMEELAPMLRKAIKD